MSIMINNGIVRTSIKYYFDNPSPLPTYQLCDVNVDNEKKGNGRSKGILTPHLLNIQAHDDNIDQQKQLQQHLKNVIMTSKPIYILHIDMGLHKWSHLLS